MLNGAPHKEERERLIYLMEECAEVVKACSKILRHGWNSYDPTVSNGPSNQDALYAELCDVLTAIDRMNKARDIYPPPTARPINNYYFHFQGEEPNAT